jgi:hypothetical protein
VPYKDIEKKREYQRKWLRRKRANVDLERVFSEKPKQDEKEDEEPFIKPTEKFGANPWNDTSESQETHEREVNRRLIEEFGEHTEGYKQTKRITEKDLKREDLED